MLKNKFKFSETLIGPKDDPYVVTTLKFIKDDKNTYELIYNGFSEISTIKHNEIVIQTSNDHLDNDFDKLIGMKTAKAYWYMNESSIRKAMQKYNMSYTQAMKRYYKMLDVENKLMRYAM